MHYKFLPEIATADIAFEAYGKKLPELFENSTLALMEVMADTKTIRPRRHVICNMQHAILEDLLFDFLSELVYQKDAKRLLFSKFRIKIQLSAKGYTLNANIWGEEIDPQRHKLRADIKAVTWHLFKIEKKNNRYLARVVLDI